MMSSYHESYRRKEDEITFELERQVEKQKEIDEVIVEVPQFWYRLGREPIPLTLIEFRIIRFLANKPYRAFTPEDIAKGVTTEQNSVDRDSLESHIRSLRDKLGMFSDYIQSVPYIGYRFKP